MIFSPGLFFTGLFLFPISHTLVTYLLKYVLPGLKYVERYGVSTRVVSGLQAIAASLVGLKAVLSCNDILHQRLLFVIDYLSFGLSYFYYDAVVMYYGVYLKEKILDPSTTYSSAWTKFYKKKKLIFWHHVLLPVIGFPISNFSWIRQDRGDFFIGCLFMSEMSTPFLSLRAVLAKLGKKNSLAYIVNGVTLAVVFFVFRVLVYPYMYWRFAVYKNISLLEVPFNIPIPCNVACFMLMSLQVNWSFVIIKGCLRYLYRPGVSKEPPSCHTSSDEAPGVHTRTGDASNSNGLVIDHAHKND